jgi:2-phosphoglycerate kinase
VTQPRHREPWPLGGDGGLPFSKGLMARALIAVGVSAERAYEVARRVEVELDASGETAMELDRFRELAVGLLGDEPGDDVVRRLRRFRALQELDLPILLLIGGATGTGKSTVATEAAHRLGITRVTSTDFVRQTMRAFFSREFMPSIHYSSFDADQALRAPEDADDPVIAGFLEQTRVVAVGVQAAIDRSLHEGWSMVLEGVHLVPGILPARPIEGALVVQCVLAIEDETAHEGHFWIRDVSSEGIRPVQKYVDRLGDIRRVQDVIVTRAHRAGVPVIDNARVEHAIDAVLELVLGSVERLEPVS